MTNAESSARIEEWLTHQEFLRRILRAGPTPETRAMSPTLLALTLLLVGGCYRNPVNGGRVHYNQFSVVAPFPTRSIQESRKYPATNPHSDPNRKPIMASSVVIQR